MDFFNLPNSLHYFAFIKPQIKLLSVKYPILLLTEAIQYKKQGVEGIRCPRLFARKNKSFFNHNKTKQTAPTERHLLSVSVIGWVFNTHSCQ